MRTGRPPLPVEPRFWARTVKSDGCWLWAAAVDRDGYGQLRVRGVQSGAHRVSWAIHYGAIPEDLHVLHHCDNPRCVRPDHLFLGTTADNTADMIAKGRHPLITLTTTDVLLIRARAGADNTALAVEFGVHKATIRRIRGGITRRYA